jgi:hypothetical protein
MTHRIAYFTLEAMLHLSNNEFTTPEREHKLGVMVSFEIHLISSSYFYLSYSFGLNGITVFFYYTVAIWLLIISLLVKDLI